jgi:hypothetical protein
VQAEIAIAPETVRPRRVAETLARLTLPGVVFLTLAFELALAERKFAIFAGGFGQSHAVDTPLDMAAFFAGLLACHGLIFYLLYRLVRRLHGRWADTPVFHFNFFYFATFAGAAVLIAKYQALSYFSDALSFQVIRNLGGGSIVEAMRYSLSEASLVLFVSLGAAAVYAGLLLFLRRRWRHVGKLPDRTRLSGRQLAAALVLTPLLLLAVGRVPDARSGLSRFNSYFAAVVLLNQATDFDRDGYSFFSWPVDAQPFDGSRHPFALDVPNNGIDEDGFAGDLTLADPHPAAPAPVTIAGERPHVIVVVFESTRGDAIGRRFGGRAVAPVMEALAHSGTYVPASFSHVGFTTESMQTFFTGRLAPRDSRGSMFEIFRDNGYRTAVFSGQAEDFGGIAETVGEHDADIFYDAERLRNERVYSLGSQSSLKLDGRTLLREFDRNLGRAEDWRRPNFIYFNFQSAHFPYAFPTMPRILPGEAIPRSEIGPANRERLEGTYWNAIAYNDWLLGQVIARLQRLGVWDHTVLAITGDHGESLFDDGFLGHGHMINRQQTQIPFIVNRRVAVAPPVGLADMRQIILRAAGAEVPRLPGATPGHVFQYIGSLDRPSSIGFADADRRWTIFSFDREAVWTSATGEWRDYRSLAPGSAGRAEADALIREWGRQRWLHQIGA